MARPLVIRGGRVLDAARRAADEADIVLAGDTIAEIGRPGLPAPADAETVDARGFLLHPGLVNAHTHGHSNLSKSPGDLWTLELLLAAGPWISGGRGAEEKYLSALIGACEMLLKGCTAAYDLMIEIPSPSKEGVHAAARGYMDAGMRAVVAATAADMTLYTSVPGLLDSLPDALQREVRAMAPAPAVSSLAAVRAILEDWPFDRARVRPAVAPAIPLLCSDDFVVACRDLARDFDVGLHTHLLESKVQAVVGRERYGMSVTRYLEKQGLLGPRFTGAHGVWTDEEDMRALAGAGANIAHNPGSNMRLGNGIARVKRMRELGVNVGIGTDSVTCSDNLNMYEAMRLAAMSSRVQSPDTGRWLTAEDCLVQATEASARALGFERIGRLAPGYKADIVFLDLGAINWIPYGDPVNRIVNLEDGTSVDSVMVGGQFAVRHRKLVHVDLAALKVRAEAAWAGVSARVADKRALFDRLAPAVNAFCPAVAARPYHVDRYPAHGA